MNDMDDKLIQMAREYGLAITSERGEELRFTVAQLAALRSAILADAAKDVGPVAWGLLGENGKARGVATRPNEGWEPLCLASTLAAAQALNAELVSRVAELGAALRTADRTFAENGILASHAARQEIQSALTKGQP